MKRLFTTTTIFFSIISLGQDCISVCEEQNIYWATSLSTNECPNNSILLTQGTTVINDTYCANSSISMSDTNLTIKNGKALILLANVSLEYNNLEINNGGKIYLLGDNSSINLTGTLEIKNNAIIYLIGENT